MDKYERRMMEGNEVEEEVTRQVDQFIGEFFRANIKVVALAIAGVAVMAAVIVYITNSYVKLEGRHGETAVMKEDEYMRSPMSDPASYWNENAPIGGGMNIDDVYPLTPSPEQTDPTRAGQQVDYVDENKPSYSSDDSDVTTTWAITYGPNK